VLLPCLSLRLEVVRRPDLDDVFLTLTGHAAEHENAEEQPVEEAVL